MATKAVPTYSTFPTSRALDAIGLDAAATGNGDSDTLDLRNFAGALLLEFLTAIGATPTVTLNIQGSVDGLAWYNIDYSLPATPGTLTQAALVITTATTTRLFIRRATSLFHYLKIVRSANTNVTLTSTAHPVVN